MAMLVIVRRRGKCVYVCIQAERYLGNEQEEWRVESGEWRSGGGQQHSQTSTPPIDTIQHPHLQHLQHLQQRQQVQQLFAMAEPTGSSLATSASAFVRYS